MLQFSRLSVPSSRASREIRREPGAAEPVVLGLKAMNNAVKLALAVALAAPSASLAAPAAALTPAARGEVKRAPQLPRAARNLQ